jgi:hypothetical protein
MYKLTQILSESREGQSHKLAQVGGPQLLIITGFPSSAPFPPIGPNVASTWPFLPVHFKTDAESGISRYIWDLEKPGASISRAGRYRADWFPRLPPRGLNDAVH